VFCRFTRVLFGMLLIALVATGCSISGDDDDGDEDTVNATEASQPEPSPTDAVEPTATLAPEVTATSTHTPEPTATATATETATPEPTPTATATATATPIPIVDNPFADVAPPDAVLENYTVDYAGEFQLPEGGTETIEMFIEQSDPAHYHLRVGAEVEIWVIGAETYFRNPDDGSVFPVPSAVDPGLVSPAAYLIQVPNPANVPEALAVGEEDIDGRSATHYSVTAEQFAQFGLTEDQTVIDPEGDIDVWIDQELGFISRMIMDVEWTDETGTRQAVMLEFTITMVGTTPEVVAPI